MSRISAYWAVSDQTDLAALPLLRALQLGHNFIISLIIIKRRDMKAAEIPQKNVPDQLNLTMPP